MRREPDDDGIPWRRTWTGLAVLAVVVGVLFVTVPYDDDLVVTDAGVFTLRCDPPITGAFGSNEVTVPDDADGKATGACPSRARERLAAGLGLTLVGIAGFVLLRRRRSRVSRRPPGAT